MVEYINYTTANISGFAQGYDYSSQVLQDGTSIHSSDLFGMLVLFGIFMVFTGLSIKLGSERAILYGSLLTSVSAALMVSGGLLTPIWLALPFSVLIISAFIWSPKS